MFPHVAAHADGGVSGPPLVRPAGFCRAWADTPGCHRAFARPLTDELLSRTAPASTMSGSDHQAARSEEDIPLPNPTAEWSCARQGGPQTLPFRESAVHVLRAGTDDNSRRPGRPRVKSPMHSAGPLAQPTCLRSPRCASQEVVCGAPRDGAGLTTYPWPAALGTHRPEDIGRQSHSGVTAPAWASGRGVLAGQSWLICALTTAGKPAH